WSAWRLAGSRSPSCRPASRFARPSASPCRTTARASGRRTCRASSIRSSARGGAGPASGWHWCIGRSRRTTARSWSTVGRGRAPTSRSTCRRGARRRPPSGGLEQMALRVLLVDDESAILHSLQILLRGEGFQVAVAQSGRDAVERFADFMPDVVLTDIRMPGMDGLELLAALRQKDPEVPVILMTAQASLQSAVQAVNQGAFYYLQKPFSNA